LQTKVEKILGHIKGGVEAGKNFIK
jgi:hypothetical protein